jgi:RNA polymerase sigma-70 factor, ECF subfamily
VAFRITCDEEEARDAVQESFIKIWENLEQYDMDRSFSAWMMKIVVNTAIDRKRQMNRHRMIRLDDAAKVLEAQDPHLFLKENDNKEMAALIHWLAEGLPEKQQLVFILRDLQGMESEEVQEILKMSADSVKSNLHIARAAIRAKLEKTLK